MISFHTRHRAPWRARAVACAGLVALSCFAAPPVMPASSTSRLLGRSAPTFRRPTVQGGRFDTGEAAGRVMVVEFFARYCQPCQRRLPAAERLRRELEPAGVVVAGISLDETPEAALQQVRRYRLGFPVVHDEGHALAGRFRVSELPAAFVVGPDGRVLWFGGPEQPDDALRQAVLAVRQGGPVAVGSPE